MAEFQIRGQVNLSTAGNGDGDPLLARDATTGAVGINSTALTASLSAGQLLVGNASNVATATTITGDVTINSSGVTAISSGVIVNADVNASAAIALTKLAATTASRALVSDGSGVISPSAVTSTELGYVSGVTSAIQTQINAKQATITGAATTITSVDLTSNRALISSGAGKVAVSSVTATEMGYLSGVTSAIQTQLNTKLPVTLTGVAQGDLIYYNGAAWVNIPKGTVGQALYSTGSSIQWDTPTINGIPTAGTTNQVLAKQSNTNFDADWETLSISYLPDITATAAELNILDGITATTTELNYVTGATSNIQTQINNKLSQTLAQNAIFVGNASNVATAYAAGSNGQVLQIVGGVPTWQTIAGTGSVTSVDVSGGTTGLTTSGGPVTTTGTITLSGTLVAVNGGTGQSSYAVGDILYASTTTALSKLAVGSNGQVLTLASGVPSWADSQPNTDIKYFDQQDFILGTASVSGWSNSGSGAGQSFSLVSPGYGIDTTENAAGVAVQTTGTTTTGRNHIFKGEFVLGTADVKFRLRVAPDTLSDGTETYTLRFGLSDLSNITGDPDDGIFFRYTHSVNSGEYQAVCRAATVESATDTNVAATTTYKVFEIRVNQAATSVTFYIDSVLVATIATNIPTGQLLNFYSQITKSAGTTERKLHLDWTEITMTRSSAR